MKRLTLDELVLDAGKLEEKCERCGGDVKLRAVIKKDIGCGYTKETMCAHCAHIEYNNIMETHRSESVEKDTGL